MNLNGNVVKKKKKRIFYFDALRALAIISVILFHVYMTANGLVVKEFSPHPSLNWWITDVLAACSRCGVDIFLMLSGALSLGRVWDIKSFLGKRLPRIAGPFLFWGFVLSLFVVILSMLFPSFWHTLNTFNIMSFLQFLYQSYMSKNPGFTQYWFFWMILGTYLIMPIFNKWLLHCDLKEVEYFLAIWAVTCIFDYTLKIPFPIKLTYFTGPIGMVVLGYYLRHTKRKIFNNPYAGLALLLIGAASLILSSYLSSTPSKMAFLERYSILYAIEVTGIFVLFKCLDNVNMGFLSNPDGVFRKSVFSIAKYSYGIYLLHRVILVLLYKYYAGHIPYKLLLLILFAGGLGISWLVMALLNRVSPINQVIGAK
ncbi:acyltransferase family protein [Methanobrevibacter sp.]|uniref:acyltransferase n=1 Tax=Methanobrevibacter sp. TaxID=66852 RepID=UPI002E78D3FF|nr:acyltransferase family protein [Methanobrevibacter sp.]MEE0939181.1 acyltransferase family protein [Methanobrevibacter sp.]